MTMMMVLMRGDSGDAYILWIIIGKLSTLVFSCSYFEFFTEFLGNLINAIQHATSKLQISVKSEIMRDEQEPIGASCALDVIY